MGPALVLGSKSPARLATLRSAGIEPLVKISGVDEDAVAAALAQLEEDPTPAQLVCAEAEAKAAAVAQACLEDLQATGAIDGVKADPYLVVGADSMLEINGKMVGKPGTAEVAIERIREMRGTDGTLWTGHALIALRKDAEGWTAEPPLVQAAQTVVHFGQITDAEIDAYVATGEPLNVAGSFTIDALGGPFVEGVTGDPHSVVGISLPLLKRLTDQAEVFWPKLWQTSKPQVG